MSRKRDVQLIGRLLQSNFRPIKMQQKLIYTEYALELIYCFYLQGGGGAFLADTIEQAIEK